MNTRGQRFDSALPDLFVELANASTPDYLEAAIAHASSRPQRPTWTFPGRWLPVQISTQAAPPARAPWRQLGVLALVGILLAAATFAYVGSRRSVAPVPPFGLAANGAIALERDGDIVSVDPATGVMTPMTSGPELDTAPAYSGDGAHIAFERRTGGPTALPVIMVAAADGTSLVRATPEPLVGLINWTLSPDASELLVSARHDGWPRLEVVAVDGSHPPTTVEMPLAATAESVEPASYRPPDGREILVVGKPAGSSTRGIYLVDPATGKTLKTVVEPSPVDDVFGASWSPSGDAIRYGRHDPAGTGLTSRQHVVSADGTGDRLVSDIPGIAYDRAWSDWSNDGTRMVLVRSESPDRTGERADIVRLDGGPAVEIRCEPAGSSSCLDLGPLGGFEWTWSPDDKVLLGSHFRDGMPPRYALVDSHTGLVTPTDWSGTGAPSWQRANP